jgi:hypothetical protein
MGDDMQKAEWKKNFVKVQETTANIHWATAPGYTEHLKKGDVQNRGPDTRLQTRTFSMKRDDMYITTTLIDRW